MKLRDIHLPEGSGTYKCKIKEVSKGLVILEIENPENLRGARAVYQTNEEFLTGESITIYGELKDWEVTFRNPYMNSYRFLKRLEGVGFQIKGKVISRQETGNTFERIRRFLGQKIERLNLARKDLIKALTIGDAISVEKSTRELFQRTGTSHILAISGTHLGIVTFSFFYLARSLIRKRSTIALRGDDKKYAALLTMPFVFFFMLITGKAIPTIRATIMAEIFLFSFVLERERDLTNTIAISAFVILLFYPHSIFVTSFQLTYLTLLSITLFFRKVNVLGKSRSFRYFFVSLLSSAAALIGTAPVIIYHFYGINPFSFIHNLFAVPLICGISLPLALLGLFLPYGEIFLVMSDKILGFSILLLDFFDFGYVYPIIRPTLIEIFIYYGFILSFLLLRGKTFRVTFTLFSLISIIFFFNIYRERFKNEFCLNFIDVGNGLSILLEGENGHRMLIDGGGPKVGDFDIGKRVVLPILLSKKILTLDYVVNTHPHEDHISGLFHIVENLRVKKLAVSPFFLSDKNMEDLIEIAKKKDIQVELWMARKKLKIENALIEVLSPISINPDPNNMSLVLKITYGKFKFLLPSDIKSDLERELVLDGSSLRAHLLLIPHHGSKNSSSMPFLLAVKPSLAILSVGRGVQDLPSKEILERYRRLQIPILRTDKDGFIRICVKNGILQYSKFW